MPTRKRKPSVKIGGFTPPLIKTDFANKLPNMNLKNPLPDMNLKNPLPDMNLKNPLETLNVKDISPNDIMKTIQDRNQLNLFPSVSNLPDQISTISKAMTIKSAEEFGDLIGVNLSDKEEVNRYLQEFKEALINPENTKETLEIIGALAKKAGLYLDASKPFLTPLIDTTVDQGSVAIEKFINSLSTIIGNSIKEIPGVGLMFATVQGAEKIGEAGLAIVNASVDVVKKGAETVEATKLNLEKTMKMSEDGVTDRERLMTPFVQNGGGLKVADRVRKSITNFLTPTITLSKVKKMFMTRKHKITKTKKTNKRH